MLLINLMILQINTINLNHPGDSSGYSIIKDKKKFCYLLDNEYKEIDTQERTINKIL